MRRRLAMALISGAVLILSFRASAAPADPVPAALQGVDVVENLGATVPLDLAFTDSSGRPVKLGDYFGHRRPVLLTLVYFRCPMLCSLVLNGLVAALPRLPWTPGRDYDLVTVSFDPADRPSVAGEKRAGYLATLGVKPDAPLWPFLTGSAMEVRTLADTLGFKFNTLAAIDQFAHPAVVFLLTADGKVSRYLYGVKLDPRDLRLALAEAAAGRAGPSLDRVLLSCFRYDPASRRYRVFVSRFLQAGGLLVFLALTSLLLWCWRLETRSRHE